MTVVYPMHPSCASILFCKCKLFHPISTGITTTESVGLYPMHLVRHHMQYKMASGVLKCLVDVSIHVIYVK